jgi:hypothetical protein
VIPVNDYLFWALLASFVIGCFVIALLGQGVMTLGSYIARRYGEWRSRREHESSLLPGDEDVRTL